MSDYKFTRGPWIVTADDDEDEEGWVVTAAEALCDTIAHPTAQPTAGEQLANARLIAAAPDLLVMLEMIVTNIRIGIGVRESEIAEAREIIAAALGLPSQSFANGDSK